VTHPHVVTGCYAGYSSLGTDACRISGVGLSVREHDHDHDHDHEKALVAALFAGVSETPLWATFLERLRRATQADNVTLVFHPPGRRYEDALTLAAGDLTPTTIEDFHRRNPSPVESAGHQPLSEGQPHSLAQLLDTSDSNMAAYRREILGRLQITAIRQMRVQEPSGVDAWLTIMRRGKDFGAQEDALLRSIVPVLRGVLQLYVGMERERFAASLNADAVRRLQFGWLALDRSGHVVDSDEQGALVLSGSGILGKSATGRLTARPPALDRKIVQALEHVTRGAQARPRAIALSHDPLLDMLLVPAGRNSMSANTAPAAIAYVHGDSWRLTDRCEQLAELFALSPREARLALALSRGMTLTEAASELKLTIGTARTYSKTIYAKTGARGLPDLVRIVMRSVVAIAPQA
jgi:DNA-binding CsgD family transcriptional regulator